jgi:hypothetical protein
MAISVNIYGGLGNQLFQLFFARCMQEADSANKLTLITGLEGRYSTVREFYLSDFSSEKVKVKKLGWFGRFRLVKVLTRLSVIDERLEIFGYNFLDGYFQHKRHYEVFDFQIIDRVIENIRVTVFEHQLVKKNHQKLCHVRLTDFFDGDSQSRNFIETLNLDEYEAFLTDDEALLGEFVDAKKIIPSQELGPFELIRIMSAYEKVVSNGSSLAFWGALLGKCSLESSHREHQELFQVLLNGKGDLIMQ